MSGLTKVVLVTAGIAIYQAYRRRQDVFTTLVIDSSGKVVVPVVNNR